MLLFIDVTDPKINSLALVTLNETKWLRFLGDHTSENLIPQIKKILIKNKRNLKDIEKIAVVVGPGPFSKIRTGVAVANALGFALNIESIALERSRIPHKLQDLLKKPGEKFVKPVYDKEPNITKSKRK